MTDSEIELETPPKPKTPELEDNKPFYEVDRLLVASEEHPHAYYCTTQSRLDEDSLQFNARTGAPDMRNPKMSTGNRRGRMLSDGAVESKAKKIEEYFKNYEVNHGGENIIGTIKDAIIGDLVGPHVRICKYLIFGMGSVRGYVGDYKTDNSWGMAIAQYNLALQIINCHLGHFMSEQEAVFERSEVEVIFDDSHMYKGDADYFVKLLGWDKLGTDNVKRFDRVTHARLGQVLEHVDTSNAIIITFVPDNPIRQMVSELDLNGQQEPPAIICASYDVDNKPRPSVTAESADLLNPSVQILLKGRYNRFPFTGAAKRDDGEPWTGADTSMIPGLGETYLHIHQEIAPLLPESHTPDGRSPRVSVGGTPEPTTTLKYYIPASTGNTPDDYRHPPDSSKESNGDQTIPYIGFLPLKFTSIKLTDEKGGKKPKLLDPGYRYWLGPE